CTGPGSFLGVMKLLPLLTAVSGDRLSFHVVVPSLPEYTWSEGVLEKGFSCEASRRSKLGPTISLLLR
ncbi:hypothetical protein H4582DRAFT_1808328, partial [Lactarius indigo]